MPFLSSDTIKETLERTDFKFFSALTISLLCLWAFIELADEVIEGSTRDLDEWLLLSLRNPEDHNDPIGPLWMEEAVRDITALGSFAIIILVVLAIAGYLFVMWKRRRALAFIMIIFGGVGISQTLKNLFDRPRPELVSHLSETMTASFPSGHALLATVVYLTIAAFLTENMSRTRARAFVMVVALGITILVGSSRVYLGVHYPTDVLAGWAAGMTWASLCWLVARMLRKRKVIESNT